MVLIEIISSLDALQSSERQEKYETLLKLLNDDAEIAALKKDHITHLCSVLLNDLKNETCELPHMVKLLQSALLNKNLVKTFPDASKREALKGIIACLESDQHENVLVNCFSILIQVSSNNFTADMLQDLLQRMEDIITKRSDSVSAYFVACNYFQKLLKDFEKKLSNSIPIIIKLVFLPLCHPSTKIREVAEKTLDLIPKSLLYATDEQASIALLKLLKESYTRDLLRLFKEKQELYVLKIWKHAVTCLGNVLPGNLPSITPFFQVIEKGFKSPVDEVCIASFGAWKSLISCFSTSKGILNDSKKLRFILKPFKNISRSSENVLVVACDCWWFLAWNLAEHLSSRFTEVCIPLIQLTVGKITNGHLEKSSKESPSSLVKKGAYILLRFLEQPPSDSSSCITSPKKMPHIPYPALQLPIELKVIVHHFKEILTALKVVVESCGLRDEMKNHLECLLKSVLFIVSTMIEESNKESVEGVTCFISFLADVIEAKSLSSVICLKCIESLSKCPRKVLVSHLFHCGPRKSQEVLCHTLLKLLLSPHLFPNENAKRFSPIFNRLIVAGLQESIYPLQVGLKFMHIIRSAIARNVIDIEVVIDVWCGIANPLLEIVEKTQEVNQGDKQEHDFSCMYDVLLFPFEFIFPVYTHQFRTRPAFKLWTAFYKAFICSASLVPTTAPNEACENFCSKLKSCLKEEIKKPHYFESVCLFLQVIIEAIDFSSCNASVDVTLVTKCKKPLGNLTSVVEILCILLDVYSSYFIEEETKQDNAPLNQKKMHVVKNSAPLDLIKSFFQNIKTGGLIPFILEQVVDPLSKLFSKSSQKRHLMNHIDAKLETVWSVITSTIERYYIGSYDSEFLSVLSPILESTFSHPKRNIKEKSRKFWFATFGPHSTTLKYPDSLKTVLIKMRLPLLGDSFLKSVEFSSASPITDSLSGEIVGIASPQPSPFMMSKAGPVKNSEVVCVSSPKNTEKEKKLNKMSIDDLPSEEFVKIEAPVTPIRRGFRKRKSFIPTLYNDLSQDLSHSQDMNSLSLSQDSQDSSLETAGCRELKSETKVSEEPKVTNEAKVEAQIPSDPLSSENEESAKSSSLEQMNEKSAILKVTSGSCLKNCDNLEDIFKKPETKPAMGVPSEPKLSVFSPPSTKTSEHHTNKESSLELSCSFPSVSNRITLAKTEQQGVNELCSEGTSELSDSEDIIPSSQDITENELSCLSFTRKETPKLEKSQRLSFGLNILNKRQAFSEKRFEKIEDSGEKKPDTGSVKSAELDDSNDLLPKFDIIGSHDHKVDAVAVSDTINNVLKVVTSNESKGSCSNDKLVLGKIDGSVIFEKNSDLGNQVHENKFLLDDSSEGNPEVDEKPEYDEIKAITDFLNESHCNLVKIKDEAVESSKKQKTPRKTRFSLKGIGPSAEKDYSDKLRQKSIHTAPDKPTKTRKSLVTMSEKPVKRQKKQQKIGKKKLLEAENSVKVSDCQVTLDPVACQEIMTSNSFKNENEHLSAKSDGETNLLKLNSNVIPSQTVEDAIIQNLLSSQTFPVHSPGGLDCDNQVASSIEEVTSLQNNSAKENSETFKHEVNDDSQTSDQCSITSCAEKQLKQHEDEFLVKLVENSPELNCSGVILKDNPVETAVGKGALEFQPVLDIETDKVVHFDSAVCENEGSNFKSLTPVDVNLKLPSDVVDGSKNNAENDLNSKNPRRKSLRQARLNFNKSKLLTVSNSEQVNNSNMLSNKNSSDLNSDVLAKETNKPVVSGLTNNSSNSRSITADMDQKSPNQQILQSVDSIQPASEPCVTSEKIISGFNDIVGKSNLKVVDESATLKREVSQEEISVKITPPDDCSIRMPSSNEGDRLSTEVTEESSETSSKTVNSIDTNNSLVDDSVKFPLHMQLDIDTTTEDAKESAKMNEEDSSVDSSDNNHFRESSAKIILDDSAPPVSASDHTVISLGDDAKSTCPGDENDLFCPKVSCSSLADDCGSEERGKHLVQLELKPENSVESNAVVITSQKHLSSSHDDKFDALVQSDHSFVPVKSLMKTYQKRKSTSVCLDDENILNKKCRIQTDINYCSSDPIDVNIDVKNEDNFVESVDAKNISSPPDSSADMIEVDCSSSLSVEKQVIPPTNMEIDTSDPESCDIFDSELGNALEETHQLNKYDDKDPLGVQLSGDDSNTKSGDESNPETQKVGNDLLNKKMKSVYVFPSSLELENSISETTSTIKVVPVSSNPVSSSTKKTCDDKVPINEVQDSDPISMQFSDDDDTNQEIKSVVTAIVEATSDSTDDDSYLGNRNVSPNSLEAGANSADVPQPVSEISSQNNFWIDVKEVVVDNTELPEVVEAEAAGNDCKKDEFAEIQMNDSVSATPDGVKTINLEHTLDELEVVHISDLEIACNQVCGLSQDSDRLQDVIEASPESCDENIIEPVIDEQKSITSAKEKGLALPSLVDDTSETEVSFVLRDLIIRVEKIDFDSKFVRNYILESSVLGVPEPSRASEAGSNCAADKENQSQSDICRLAKGSKKRKNKPPIRSSFTFRQRCKVDKKHSTSKSKKVTTILLNSKPVLSTEELILNSVLSKTERIISLENTSGSLQASSSVSTQSPNDFESCLGADENDAPSAPVPAASKVKLSYDELTNLNTRLNASVAPQTRRSRMIAASQKSFEENEGEVVATPPAVFSDLEIVCTGDPGISLCGILKKRKTALPGPSPSKKRKVTFASPLIQELVFERFNEVKGVETIRMSNLQTQCEKKKKKILQEKNKVKNENTNGPSTSVMGESPYECLSSDGIDFTEFAVSPALINCTESISHIIKDLTSPSWVTGLESILISKNIKTIGDVCKLNIHELKALPFKSPKVQTLHKALIAYLNKTQESVLEKVKALDDGSREMDSAKLFLPNCSSEITITAKPAIPEESHSIEESIKESITSSLKELSLSSIGQLLEACGKIIVEKSAKS